MNFSKICYHDRTTRINNEFVKCVDCGQKIISIQKHIANKTRDDFTRESKVFHKSFDKNFSNEIDFDDEDSKYVRVEYYVDRNRVNNIVVNRLNKYFSNPPKYDVNINDKKTLLTDVQIDRLLRDTNAMRVDEHQFYEQIF
uniref:Uncharacterized protein n=1 Tax=viral metagenome TaxID=1070528 RepID=A0A6C0CAW0_9ZZZZ